PSPRLVVLDAALGLPECHAFASAYRALPCASATRVAFLRPVSDTSLAQPAAAEGFHWTLGKPVRPSQLFNGIMSLFGDAPQVQPTPSPSSHLELPAATRRLRLLVAEDHEVNRRLALLMLEKLGCRADIAGNGNEVLAALQRQPYDVIFMDCQMPELDGFATTRAIRNVEKSDPKRQRIHIIALTANAMRGDREACIACGMDSYITKPVKLDALAGALHEAGKTLAQSQPPAAPLPGPEPADFAAIDAALTQMHEDFGPEAVAELLGDFLREAGPRLAELREHGRTSDAETYGRAAHSFAGGSSIFGLERVRKTALAVEAAVRASQPDDARRLVEELTALYTALEPRLREHFARVQPVPTA
ncbi:MAG: response regulator, partial [Verrucomicrobiales bacterium]|nr:response regulator [Verrucomicrobiales bacterium]